jgi:hypothetical protein
VELNELAEQWRQAEEELKTAKQRFDDLTNEIAQMMIVSGVKSELAYIEDREYKITVVERETLKFDEDSLLKAIGKRAFSKISNMRVDRKKLEQAVRSGEISTELIAANTVVSRSAPYLRVSEYKEEPEDG